MHFKTSGFYPVSSEAGDEKLPAFALVMVNGQW